MADGIYKVKHGLLAFITRQFFSHMPAHLPPGDYWV